MYITAGIRRIGRLLLIVIVLLSHSTLTLCATPPDPDSTSCSHFVDNQSESDGDGSQANPWNDIASHVNDLSPGDVMCIRGDHSAPGRVYSTGQIKLTQSGTADQAITIQPYIGERVILRNSHSDPLLIFNGVHYWIVEGLTLDHNNRWTRAILFRENASHNILRGSEIMNGRTDGIVITKGASGNIIESNHIHDFINPDFTRDAHCILVQIQADETIIRNNTIHDCSGDGVQLIENELDPSDTTTGVKIVGNLFYRGTIARAENAIDIKAADDLTVTANRMYGYVDSNVITLQKESQNVLFEGNVIYDSARGFFIHSEGTGRPRKLTISNNLIYDMTDYAIQISGVRDGTIVHNTIVNAEHGLRVVLGGLSDGLIQNNLFFDCEKTQLDRDTVFSNVIVGYNGWFDAKADSVFTQSSDIVSSGDPGFVDAASHDYHLSAASPARDAGTNVGVTTDLDGDVRPWGDHPDLGADEYTSASPPPTPYASVWNDICVPQRVEITGFGMGDRYHTINPQTLSLSDPADVSWLLTQVAGTTLSDTPIPESVTFSTDLPQTFTRIMPTSSGIDFTFEQHLEPTGHVTATISGVGDTYKTPRALVLYSKRSVPDAWTSVGRTTYGHVYAGSGDHTHTEVLTFPPLVQATDLLVNAVVIDNDDDSRPLVLGAEAGSIANRVTEYGPTHGAGLTVFNLTLSQVPAGTSGIVLTFQSPADNGDSGALVGINISYRCLETQTASP